MDVIGIIPACGKAERLSPLPCSKEIYPVGLQYSEYYQKFFPKVVCDHLLDYFKNAKIPKVHFIIRSDKQDIPEYFKKREDIPLNISFSEMNHSPGTPFTIDSIFDITQDKISALGFPDILIKPSTAYQTVLAKLVQSNFDIVLGLFPIERKYSWDMVEFNQTTVEKIIIKSPDTVLDFGWTIAIWKPSFTAFMHEYLKQIQLLDHQELYVGNVIQAAISAGLKVGYELFDSGACIDLGKPEDLKVIYKDW